MYKCKNSIRPVCLAKHIDLYGVLVDFYCMLADFYGMHVDFYSMHVDFYAMHVDFYDMHADFYGMHVDFYVLAKLKFACIFNMNAHELIIIIFYF